MYSLVVVAMLNVPLGAYISWVLTWSVFRSRYEPELGEEAAVEMEDVDMGDDGVGC